MASVGGKIPFDPNIILLKEEVEEDVEMAASQRRFEEIIKKHRKDGGKGNL